MEDTGKALEPRPEVRDARAVCRDEIEPAVTFEHVDESDDRGLHVEVHVGGVEHAEHMNDLRSRLLGIRQHQASGQRASHIAGIQGLSADVLATT